MKTSPLPGLADDTSTKDARAGLWSRTLLLFRNLKASLDLVKQVSRKDAYTYLIAGALESVLPVPIAWVGKEIIDQVSAPTRDVKLTVMWVAIECVLVLGRIALSQRLGYQGEVLRGKLVTHVDLLIFKKAQSLSLSYFEDPKFMDRLERARKESSWRPIEAFTQGFAIVRNGVTVLGLASLLVGFSPLAALAVLGAAIPFLAEAHFSAVQYEIKQRRTLDERRAGYLGQMLTSESYAKEVKLFGLKQLFLDRYESIQRGFLSEDRMFAMRRGFYVTSLYFASTVIFYGVFVWIALAALDRRISIGEMTMYLLVFRQAQSSLSTAMNGLARTLGDTLYLRNLFGFLNMAEDEPLTESATPSTENVSPSEATFVKPATVEFDNVTFCYPGSHRVALQNLSLKIAAGETIAIVGKNGAGKSTLVKLLAGLYSPTSGRILVNGKDISMEPLAEVRRQVSVVLQDFAHYHFSAADNIGLGDVGSLTDLARINAAAEKGGATDVVAELPQGLDTILGRVFGGEQLSVGQWQRVALSRAFMRPSPILILDEPTSAIDPEGEYELFVRMKELAKDRTCILITHRFSTVRIADRIITIEDGRIIEDGSHQALLEKNGTYAHMFNLQAQGYQ